MNFTNRSPLVSTTPYRNPPQPILPFLNLKQQQDSHLVSWGVPAHFDYTPGIRGSSPASALQPQRTSPLVWASPALKDFRARSTPSYTPAPAPELSGSTPVAGCRCGRLSAPRHRPSRSPRFRRGGNRRPKPRVRPAGPQPKPRSRRFAAPGPKPGPARRRPAEAVLHRWQHRGRNPFRCRTGPEPKPLPRLTGQPDPKVRKNRWALYETCRFRIR
jgi:hypothetical protein